MKNKLSTKMFRTLLFVLISIAMLPLSISWYPHHRILIDQLYSQADEELAIRAKGLSEFVSTWTDMSFRVLKQNTSLEDIFLMNPARQKQILQSVGNEYGYHLVQTLMLDGKAIARSDDKALNIYADRKWFIEAAKGNYNADIIIGRTYGKPTCTLAAPIFDSKQKMVGVINTSMWTTPIAEKVNKKIGETGYGYVLNTSGRVLAHYHKKMTEGVVDFSKHPVLIELGNQTHKKVIFNDKETNKKIVAFVQKGKYDWVAIAQQDYDEAYAAVLKANRIALILAVAILLIVILVAWFAASHLTRLIEQGKNIALRFGVASAVLALLPIGIVWVVNYQFLQDHTRQQIDRTLNLQAEALTARTNLFIDMNIKMLRQSVSLSAIKSMEPKKQLPILQSIVKEYPWFWVTAITAKDGIDTARSDNGKPSKVGDRKYFQQALSGSPFSNEIVIGRTSGKVVNNWAVPILNNEQKIVGVLRGSSFLSELSDVALNVKLGKAAIAYLLTDTGMLAGHQKKAYIQTMLDFSQSPPFLALGKKNKEKVSFVDKSSKKRMFSYTQRTELGWIVVVQQDLDEAMIPLKQVNERFLSICLGALTLAMIIAFALMRYVRHRLGNFN